MVRNQDEIIENEELIRKTFDLLKSNEELPNLDEIANNIQTSLELDDEETEEIGNSLLTAITNLDKRFIEELYEQDADKELVELLKELKIEYHLPLTRMSHRMSTGRKFWNNLKTEIGVRSGNVTFHNEITVDYDETLEFDSSMQSTLMLTNHFLAQLRKAPNILGEDSLERLRLENLEAVKEQLEELIEDVEEYQKKKSEDEEE